MGSKLISIRGDGPWRGVSTSNSTDRGQRFQLKMENAYVSQDGSEIRHFPGFFTLLDLSAANNQVGYSSYINDVVAPVLTTTPNDTYQFGYDGKDSRLLTLEGKAKPVHYHGFEQIGQNLVIWGESRFVEYLLYTSSRVQLVITSITITGTRWVLQLSGTTEVDGSSTNATGAGMNGISVAEIIYIDDDIVVADATLQAAIEAQLYKKMHEIRSIGSSSITLFTDTAGATASNEPVISGGLIHKIRFNRLQSYSTPNGTDPYSSTTDEAVDDPDALTAWRVVDPLDRTDTLKQCYPAWVANRRRDQGDQISTPSVYQEGVVYDTVIGGVTVHRGLSRREKRRLPYRTNPETATDRIILAAPAYGCMFQIPLKTPINPSGWPLSPSNGPYGIPFQSNDIYDQPRCLGIPKARLVESTSTPAPTSPSDFTSANWAALPILTGSPEFGLPAGTYQFAIAYEDSGIGEEGLASEPVEITIPANNYAYTLGIHYIHPGYIMPECLADKVNVYIAPPGESALAFYASFPLSAIPFYDWTTPSGLNSAHELSSKYGFHGGVTPSDPYALYHQIQMPLIGTGTDLVDVLDPDRLAPESASMPRGAEACKYIRGVLFSGGHTGNTGGSFQLWTTLASSGFDNGRFNEPGMIYMRCHPSDAEVPGSAIDGATDISNFGVAGRTFPDAYEGSTFGSADLLPGGYIEGRVDRVLNRKTSKLEGANYYFMHYERLSTTHDRWDRTRVAGASPNTVTETRLAKNIWFKMFQGQLQISDPGAPGRASKAAIKIIDPNRGDDITAIGQVAGTAIICTRRETYSFAWYRNAGSEEPNLVTNEHGCIAANSMVEFDGGLAWISEHGPVAIGGSGVQYIGKNIQEWFHGTLRRYQTDSRGMMRHTWSCHDSSRGLVMWGMVTSDNEYQIPRKNGVWADDAKTILNTFDNADDGDRSRCACDEVLIYSYRSGAFSTWRPPTGLEVLWMRPLRDVNGEVRVCFLASDGILYALDDAAHDCSAELASIEVSPATAGSGTTLTINGTFVDFDSGVRLYDSKILRDGALVEVLNDKGQIVGETTIASASFSSSVATITLTSSLTWKTSTSGWKVRIGGRQRATIVSSFIGAEAFDNIRVQATQMRYALTNNPIGEGSANARVTYLKSDRGDREDYIAADPTSVLASQEDIWPSLGSVSTTSTFSTSRRITFNNGDATAPEIAVQIELTGSAQTRIQDVSLEVA